MLSEDERDSLGRLAAHEVLARADALAAELERSHLHDLLPALWHSVGLAYRAGRLHPQPLAGEGRITALWGAWGACPPRGPAEGLLRRSWTGL